MQRLEPDEIPSRPLSRPLLLAAAATGLLAFLLYLRTLAPTLPTGDSGDLITAAWVLGVPHPPGYPLQTVLGHLFTLIPIGDPAYRVNLMSAVADALAIAGLVVLVFGLVGRREGDRADRRTALFSAIVAGLFLATSGAFWRYSLVAEVFALNNLFAVSLLLVLLRWRREPERWRFLAAFFLLAGLAATNQQTIVLLAPGLAILLAAGLRELARRSRDRSGLFGPYTRPVRHITRAVPLLLVGLLPYLYLPIAAAANPPVNWGDSETPGAFIDVVTRSAYGTFRLTAEETGGSPIEHVWLFGGYLVRAFTPLGIGLAVVGSWSLLRRHRPDGLAIVTAFLVSGPLFVAFANISLETPIAHSVLERFYILPAIPFAIAIGAGAYDALAWLSRMVPPDIRRVAIAGGACLLIAAPMGWGLANYAAIDQSSERIATGFAHDILDSLESDALLLVRGDEKYSSLAYAQFVEDLRPDVIVLDVELLKGPWFVRDIRRRYPGVEIPFAAYDDGATTSLANLVRANLGDRPIYYAGTMKEADWTAGFDESRLGLVRRLRPQGAAPDPNAALRDNPAVVTSLDFPERDYPATTWERLIAAQYGQAAFDVAFALHGEGSADDDKLAEDMYRAAIRLAPELTQALKNLGLLLRDRGADRAEIIALWERFLEISPNDPQAAAIRAAIDELR